MPKTTELAAPVGWVKNLNGPVRQYDMGNRLIMIPRDRWVAVYDAEIFRLRFQAHPEIYETTTSEAEVRRHIGAAVTTAPAIQVLKPKEGDRHPLSYVEVVTDAEGGAADTRLKLANGDLVPINSVIEAMKAKGDLKIGGGGWIKIHPGTESETNFKSIERLVDALKDENGLLMPPDAEAGS